MLDRGVERIAEQRPGGEEDGPADPAADPAADQAEPGPEEH